MKRIVLPGFGNPVTFTPKENSTIGVLVNGQIVHLNLAGGVATRVEFLKSLPSDNPAVVAA